MKPAPLWIVGAGGHAKVCVATARKGGYEVPGLIDPRPDLRGATVLGAPVHDDDDLLPRDAILVVAVGDNRARARLAAAYEGHGFATLVHPRAEMAEGSSAGEGSVVFAGAVLQPGATVGRHAIINTGAIVEHDCRVGPFATVGPRACIGGASTVGEGAIIGLGASVIHQRTIGDHALVGAGAVVVDDVPSGAVVVGVPARVVRQRDPADLYLQRGD